MEQGNLIWITGASTGIGRATALELAHRGHRVIVSARSVDKLAALAVEGASKMGEIISLPLDVCDAAAVRAAVDEVAAKYGIPDVVFLNAGGWNKSFRNRLKENDLREVFDLNFFSVAYMAELVLPLMKARGHGQLVMTASVAGYGGLPGAYGYTASKAALINLAESLRIDYAPHNITVQVVNPGFVKTPLTDQNNHPMPFLISAEEAGRRIVEGLEGADFEIAFPRRMVWLMKLLRMLPYAAYFTLMRLGGPKESPKAVL